MTTDGRTRVAIACQELLFIEMLNRGIARGRITDPDLRPMRVSRISMDRELNYRSKLDRRPEHLGELREFGRTKWRWFERARNARRTIFTQGGGVTAMGIRITGIGAYVPERVMTNYELAKTVNTSHEWIVAKTGIVERRLSAPGEAPSDMGVQAAQRCLQQRGRRQIRGRSDRRRVRDPGSVAAGGGLPDPGKARA